MMPDDPLTDLSRLVREAALESLPQIVGALEIAKAAALARLINPPPLAAPAEVHLLTMPEVATRLGITEHQAREMGRRGELPVTTVGERFVRVRSGALNDWIRRREGATLSRPGGR